MNVYAKKFVEGITHFALYDFMLEVLSVQSRADGKTITGQVIELLQTFCIFLFFYVTFWDWSLLINKDFQFWYVPNSGQT